MAEFVRTLVFVGAAVLSMCAAGFAWVLARPGQEDLRVEEQVGQVLFADKFKDPADANSLEIIKVDEDLGSLKEFKVARDKATQRWVIPSHGDYPADAEQRMQDAALMFIDVPVLGIATQLPDDHTLYGVVEPNEQTASSARGVGTLVSIDDKGGDPLARLIIGKKVKDAENQRFVRIPGQDVVYTVEIDPERLSTRFDDWIEKDLLQLSSFDVANARFKDYTILNGSVINKSEVDVSWDRDQSQWKLDRIVEFDGNRARPVELLPTEELNRTKLDEMKTALDDLQIVSVVRKPGGLAADLTADESILKDDTAIESLMSRGFYLPRVRTSSKLEIYAAHGEMHVGTTDGVEYVLRFGDFARDASSGDGGGQLNRYLFVTTRVDESKFPLPVKESLPELQPANDKAEGEPQPPAEETDPAAEDKPADDKPADDKPADDKPADDKPTDDKPVDDKPVDDKPADDKPVEDKPVEDKPADDKPADDKPADDKPADDKPADDTAREAERARIEKQYERDLEERNEKLEEARQKVRELNGRFADWYYVISDEQYKKIRLGRAQLIRESEKATEEGFGVDAFRKLEEEGPQGASQ